MILERWIEGWMTGGFIMDDFGQVQAGVQEENVYKGMVRFLPYPS